MGRGVLRERIQYQHNFFSHNQSEQGDTESPRESIPGRLFPDVENGIYCSTTAYAPISLYNAKRH